MAQTMDLYMPFATGAGSNVSEDMWHKFMRRPTVTGVLRNILEEFQVFADSTGMQVKVMTGEVWIDGFWGSNTAWEILPITTAHATLTRIDRVVARLNLTTKVVELEVNAGTPGSGVAAGITRTSTIYDVSLATVTVPATDTSIDAGQVTDARMFGGVPYTAVTDDQYFYGEKMSSTTRQSCSNPNTLVATNAYVERMASQVDNVISTVMCHVITAQIGGTCTYWIYKGFTQRDLAQVATGTITLSGGADVMKTATFTPVTIEAGTQVAVAMRVSGSSTDPTIAGTSNVVSGNFTNPSSPFAAKTSVFKTATPGTTLDLLDGSWTNSTVFRWMGLR